jgi:hypothetical protein
MLSLFLLRFNNLKYFMQASRLRIPNKRLQFLIVVLFNINAVFSYKVIAVDQIFFIMFIANL